MAKSSKNDINEIILSTVQDSIIEEVKQFISLCVKEYLTEDYKLIIKQSVRDVIEDIGIIPERKDKKKVSTQSQPEVVSGTFDDLVPIIADVAPTVEAAPEPKAETIDSIDMSDILDSIDKEK
jgi:hypothetical protein